MGKRCKATRKNGTPCNAYALAGDDYCYAHSPAKGKERAAARKKGGYNRRSGHQGNPESVPEQVRSMADVLLVLDYALQEIIILENGINRARALISLSDTYSRVLQVSELEERIARLEQAYQMDKELH